MGWNNSSFCQYPRANQGSLRHVWCQFCVTQLSSFRDTSLGKWTIIVDLNCTEVLLRCHLQRSCKDTSVILFILKLRIKNSYPILLWSFSTAKITLKLYRGILYVIPLPPRTVITTEASLTDKRLEPLLHDLFGIPKSLLDRNHLSSAHRVVRVNEPVLFLNFHPRLIVNLIYHYLQVIVFLFLYHVQELRCLDLDGLWHRFPLGHNGS